MTVGQLKALLNKAHEDEDAVVCVNCCEEVRDALSGGEWVVVSGYFEVDRVCVGDGAAVLYVSDEVE